MNKFKLIRNLFLIIGGLGVAIILNHYNCHTEGFNFLLVLGVGTHLSVASFGMYLLVNEK
jgi:hypothetical protein